MKPDPDRLTVLGVRPSDSRLEAELWRYVPEAADAIYRPRFDAPSRSDLALGTLLNPPTLAYVLLLLAIRRYRDGSPLPATVAIESLAARRPVPVHDLGVDPLDGILDQGPLWTIGAWATTLLVAGAASLAALDPTTLSVSAALVTLPLAASFVLAHAGAHLERRDDAIATAALHEARQSGHARPVLIVQERHVPGVSDRAKDRLVSTESRTVSSDLAADGSLY